MASQRQNHAQSWFPVKNWDEKYANFFAQGSCVKTKSDVAEIKRIFHKFLRLQKKKSASYLFHSTYGKKGLVKNSEFWRRKKGLVENSTSSNHSKIRHFSGILKYHPNK